VTLTAVFVAAIGRDRFVQVPLLVLVLVLVLEDRDQRSPLHGP